MNLNQIFVGMDRVRHQDKGYSQKEPRLDVKSKIGNGRANRPDRKSILSEKAACCFSLRNIAWYANMIRRNVDNI